LTAGLVLLNRGTTHSAKGPSEAVPVVAEAKRVIDLLTARQFARATERWDAGMAAALPPSRVEQFWNNLVGQVGALRSVGAAAVLSEGLYQTVRLPLRFERAELVASITYDAGGRVAGVYFSPMT
jgi:hypothetical protein